MPIAPVVHGIHAQQDAWLATVDTEAIGRGSGALGAGRETIDDVIDPAVGLALHAKVGDRLQRGEVIGTILARSEEAARAGEEAVLGALGWSPRPVDAPPLIYDVIDDAEGRPA